MGMLFKGYSAAILSQVPYSVISIMTYEYLNENVFRQKDVVFNRYDEVPFLIKFSLRFGAATFSLLLA